MSRFTAYTVHFKLQANGWQWDDHATVHATPETLREDAAGMAAFLADQRRKYHDEAATAWPTLAQHYSASAGWVVTSLDGRPH